MSDNPEKTFFFQEGVLITSQRAEFSGKTFAMANITSVSMSATEQTHETGCGCFLLLAALAAIPIGLGVNFFEEGSNFAVGVVLMIIGIAWVIGMFVQFMREKPTKTYKYAVNLTSASGETKALESSNEQQVATIVEAIKQAIVERDTLVASTPQQGSDLSPGNIPEKLRELKALLDAGIITSQEYDNKKTDLLAQL